MPAPWLKFYPTDWRADPALRMCSPAARGVWIDMICLMHDATPYGHLLVNGHCPTDAQVAVLTGTPSDQLSQCLRELEEAGVFSRTKDGVIFSRKMTRIAKKEAASRKAGQKGGNPKLTMGYAKPGFVYVIGRRQDGACKIGVSVNPKNRIKKIRAQYRGHDLEILGQVWADDMGTLERTLHETLHEKCVGGEWFLLSDNDLKNIRKMQDPKGSGKGDPFTQKLEARDQSKKREANASQKKGTRLPEDWTLPKSFGDWALKEGWAEPVIRLEAEKFKDYWIAVPGQKGVKLDWSATWRNHMRRSKTPKIVKGEGYAKPSKQDDRFNAFLAGARGTP